VCTSSLDLGVDFSPVDQVIQIGSPKGIARLLQRDGGSGHRPGAVSSIVCVPTHAFDLGEIAAVRQALADGRLEQRKPLELSLDVLVQHLVTLAVGGGFEAPDILDEIRSTYAYRHITAAEWRWALDFVTRGGEALQHYPQYQKVVHRDNQYYVEDPRIARLHRMSVGTITSASVMRVKFVSGGDLGHIEEAFIARLKPRDGFVFAGRRLELARVRDMTAYVRLAKSNINNTPRWSGSRLPISGELAAEMLAVMQQQAAGASEYIEMRAVAAILALQQRWSALPQPGALLIEQMRSREGRHLFCYPFAGRALHEGLAALAAYRLSRIQPVTYTISFNDYGFELLSAKAEALREAQLRAVFSLDGLRDDILASINLSELAKRQFRDIARIAGLVFQGYPGQDKSARQLQASSGLIYDVLARYDNSNLLLDQATREVLDHQLEYHRLSNMLQTLSEQPLMQQHPPKLTPLAFPLWAERVQFQVSSESWKERVGRMVIQLEKAADKQAGKKDRSTRRSASHA
jgi:ATP-dependent Lhr-like helicase